MGKWRKKPVVVEAEIYHPGLEDGFEQHCIHIQECLDKSAETCEGVKCSECEKEAEWILKPYIWTLEGNLYISEGDYIITGIKGERYPCKPDIFLATYEEV